MIKVIKHGNSGKYATKQFEKKCPICKCVFTFEDSDIKVDGIQIIDEAYSIECPECHHKISSYVLDKIKYD